MATTRRRQQEPNTDLPPGKTRRRKPIKAEHMVNIRPMTENQGKVFRAFEDGKNLFVGGAPGTGKTYSLLYLALQEALDENSMVDTVHVVRSAVATRDIGFLPGPQPLDARILTPTGWTEMGSLSVGDMVIGRNGQPAKITGIYPKGEKEVYEIILQDGRSTRACGDHLWLTQNYNERKHKKPGQLRSTVQIMNDLTHVDCSGRRFPNQTLPEHETVEFDSIELPIPSYVLGVLLGDGTMGKNAIPTICSDPSDVGIFERCSALMSPLGMVISKAGAISHGGSLYANKPTAEERDSGINWKNTLKNELDLLGLLGRRAWEKFIPKDYIYRNSVENRIALLQGMMDTDGTCKRNGESTYDTTSNQLALDLVELVRSLGGVATIRSRGIRQPTKHMGYTITPRRISFTVNVNFKNGINPFSLTRKAERFQCKNVHRPVVVSVQPVGVQPVQCIMIDSDEHLYLTDDFIVTHNTEEEKLECYYGIYYSMISKYFADFDAAEMMAGKLKEQGTIQYQSTSFLRGSTFDNSIILVDECQNMSYHELATLVTRVGQNTRILFSGDINQSDLKERERGWSQFVQVMEAMPEYFSVIYMDVDDIVRSDLCKAFIKKQVEMNIWLM